MAFRSSSDRAEPAGRGSRRFPGWLRSRLVRAWNPPLYAGLILAFLMGRAQPISPVAPFGIAFYMAVRAAGFGGLAALPVALALLGGAALVQPLSVFATTAMSIGLVHALAGLTQVSRRHSPLIAAVLASAVAAGQGLFQDPAAGTVQLTFWASLTGVLALIFTLAVADLTRGRYQESAPFDLPIPAIILLASAFTGLQDLTLWGQLSLHGLFAGLAVLLCAHAGGMGWGAAAGAVIGMSSFLTVLANPPGAGLWAGPSLSDSQGMAYVVAGFLGGAFRDLKKPGVGLAYALGFLSYSMATQGQGAVLEAMVLSAAAATVLFWLVPSAWVAGLAQALRSERREPPAREAAPQEDGAVLGARERLRAMAQVLKEIQRTYTQVAAVSTSPEPAVQRRLRTLNEQVCQSCSMLAQCWEKEEAETRQLLADLWQQIEEQGHLPLSPLPAALEQRCIHPAQVAVTLNHLHDLDRSDRALAAPPGRGQGHRRRVHPQRRSHAGPHGPGDRGGGQAPPRHARCLQGHRGGGAHAQAGGPHLGRLRGHRTSFGRPVPVGPERRDGRRPRGGGAVRRIRPPAAAAAGRRVQRRCGREDGQLRPPAPGAGEIRSPPWTWRCSTSPPGRPSSSRSGRRPAS